MSWKWNTEPLSWKDKCSMCQQPLRVQGDGGVALRNDAVIDAPKNPKRARWARPCAMREPHRGDRAAVRQL